GDVRGAHWDAASIRRCVPRLASRRKNARGMFRGDIPDRCSRCITIAISGGAQSVRRLPPLQAA
ncbi:MAG: hypothetical protein KBG45_07575, partial [Ottowia sp.]|nr:hypothetical protein [Ottowia sp.]